MPSLFGKAWGQASVVQQVCALRERGRSDAHLDLRWTLRCARPATAGLTWRPEYRQRPTYSYPLRTSIIKTSCVCQCVWHFGVYIYKICLLWFPDCPPRGANFEDGSDFSKWATKVSSWRMFAYFKDIRRVLSENKHSYVRDYSQHWSVRSWLSASLSWVGRRARTEVISRPWTHLTW